MSQRVVMDDTDFEQYSQNSVHFFSRTVPDLLSKAMENVRSTDTLVDIGCGDGHLVWALTNSGQIRAGVRVLGVDISPIRLQRFKTLTGFEAVLGDGQSVPSLPNEIAAVSLSTMVIEHVADDQGHADELARITRPGGWLYLSTVIRKPGAWYFRKAPDGRRVLDPTHLREYGSEAAVARLVEQAGFVIKERRLSRLVFPIAVPLIRWWHARWPIKDVQRLFLRPSTAWLESIGLPIPRYRSIEILAQKTSGVAGTATLKAHGGSPK